MLDFLFEGRSHKFSLANMACPLHICLGIRCSFSVYISSCLHLLLDAGAEKSALTLQYPLSQDFPIETLSKDFPIVTLVIEATELVFCTSAIYLYLDNSFQHLREDHFGFDLLSMSFDFIFDIHFHTSQHHCTDSLPRFLVVHQL